MQEAAQNLPAETDRFGLRHHGTVIAGVVTMPSGHTAGSINAYPSTIAVSGKAPPYGPVSFDAAADVYLKNYAVLSFDEVLYNTHIMGKPLGKAAVPFVAPSGRVWLVGATENWSCSAATLGGTAKRFGLFGKGAVSSQHNITITNPVSADADLAGCALRLVDATRDGAKRIYRAEGGGVAMAWLELTVAEVSATQITASLAVVRTVAQTRGTFSYQARVYSTVPLDRWDVLQSVNVNKVIDTATHERFEYTPAAPNYLATPASGTLTVTGYVRLNGHIYNMLYDNSGALLDGTMDVSTEVSGASSISLLLSASGSCTVDRTYSGATVSETITGTVEVEVGGTLSSTITAASKMSWSLGGVSAGSTEYTVTGVVTSNTSEKETGGAGANYSYHPTTPSLHVVTTLVSNSTETYEFKADGVSVKTYARAPSSTNQTTARGGTPIVRGGPAHNFATVSMVPDTVGGGSPPPESSMYGQMSVGCNVIDQVLGQVYPVLMSRVRRRSNSVLSVPGAMITSRAGSHTIESAWDSHLIGRNGVLDPSKPAVVAVYGGGEVTWDLPSVAEQPITGEWVRGATATQDVGFV